MRVAGELRLQDTKTEESDSVLPLPEVTWVTLLDHQAIQERERPGLGTPGSHCARRAPAGGSGSGSRP
jgi:hypothetical protein